MSVVLRDPALLVPAFRERVELLLEAIKARGYEPKVHETLRSLERSAALVASGQSQVKNGPSMHCYGIAADIICKAHAWGCGDAGCHFFDVLHQEALKAKLTRVQLTNPKTGKKFWDGPHVQAVPTRLQPLVRSAAPEHINTLVRTHFAGLLVAK